LSDEGKNLLRCKFEWIDVDAVSNAGVKRIANVANTNLKRIRSVDVIKGCRYSSLGSKALRRFSSIHFI
jgi:hypothetical protein